MNIPPNLRWVFLGLALCVTLAAAALVGEGENVAEATPRNGVAVAVPSAADRTSSPSPRGGDGRENKQAGVPLEKLNRAAMSESDQNLFAAKSWYIPPPPPKPAPPPAPTAPPLPFTYLGKLQEESGKLVVYLVKGDTAYSVSEGDVIDSIYRVEAVTAGQVIFVYIPLDIKQTLVIGNNS